MVVNVRISVRTIDIRGWQCISVIYTFNILNFAVLHNAPCVTKVHDCCLLIIFFGHFSSFAIGLIIIQSSNASYSCENMQTPTEIG